MSVSPWCNVSRTFMTLTFDLNIKVIFSQWIWVWQDVFALWHRHTKFLHMCVSPWDNMFCTFLTVVWPWPLTYIWVVGVSLVSFTHNFYLVWFCREIWLIPPVTWCRRSDSKTLNNICLLCKLTLCNIILNGVFEAIILCFWDFCWTYM